MYIDIDIMKFDIPTTARSRHCPVHLEFVLTVLRPLGPVWAGVMQGFQDGAYPNQSDVVCLPMIDMNLSYMYCIYSTLKYVSSKAEQTFDHLVYWKANTIVAGEPEGSDTQSIGARLEGFHTEMSLLWYIEKAMDNSGL